MDPRVDIWTIPLDDYRVNLLTPEEAERAARFRFEKDRLRWTAARSALRTVLAQYVPHKDVVFVNGPHGKPHLQTPAVEFNLSHARNWALIAVSRNTPVGVDLERIREGVDMAKLLARLGETDLPSDSTALFQRWSEREARTKATGAPLLELPAATIRALPLTAPPGFVAAVAMPGTTPKPRTRDFICVQTRHNPDAREGATEVACPPAYRGSL